MKDKPETLIQCTMGIKWNSGSLLDMEAHMPSATQNDPKEQKETTKEGGISLTIMGQRSIYNSIHNPQRSTNETLGFNQDDHPYRMCNETGIPEFLELQIPGIPMVVIVTSHVRSLRDPTQQDFIILSTRAPYLYINVTHVSSSEEPSRVHYAI